MGETAATVGIRIISQLVTPLHTTRTCNTYEVEGLVN